MSVDITEQDVAEIIDASREDAAPGSVIIKNNLREYAISILESMFPHCRDGLKCVHRRLIYAMYQGFGSKPTKSSRAVSEARIYHNHGDSGIYDTGVGLAVQFRTYPPLITFGGESGSYASPYAAASRYTDMSVSEVAEDLFFNGIAQNVLEKKPSFDFTGFEPISFVPAIPTALWLIGDVIGYGYAALDPPRNFTDVCHVAADYCEWIGKHGRTRPFPIHKYAEKLLPDFPIKNVLLNGQELLSAYRRGDFTPKIEMEGTATLTQDQIIIHTLPHNVPFHKLEERIQDEMVRKGSWMSQNVHSVADVSNVNNSGTLQITLKRNVDVFDGWREIRKFAQFRGAFTPNPNYLTLRRKIAQMSPLALLSEWYTARLELLMSSKRHQLSDMYASLRIIEAELIVNGHSEEVIAIIKTSADPAAAIERLKERFRLTGFQASAIAKKTFVSLTSTEMRDLEQRAANLRERINTLRNSFFSVPIEMADTARKMAKKHGVPRVSWMPSYIGYVSVGKGVIQIESVDEIHDILDNFQRGTVSVHLYDGPHLFNVTEGGKLSNQVSSKYAEGDIYGMPVSPLKMYTVNISDEGTACCVTGIVPGTRDQGFFYTPRYAYGITRTGIVRQLDVTKDIVQRKSIGRGASTDLVHIFPAGSAQGDLQTRHYVITSSDHDPNILYVQLVRGDTERIILNTVGNVNIIHTHREKDWYFTLPQSHVNRCGARVFHIPDVQALLEGKASQRIDIGQTKWKKSSTFKLLA